MTKAHGETGGLNAATLATIDTQLANPADAVVTNPQGDTTGSGRGAGLEIVMLRTATMPEMKHTWGANPESSCWTSMTYLTQNRTGLTKDGCALYAWLFSQLNNSGSTTPIGGYVNPHPLHLGRARVAKYAILNLAARRKMTGMNLAHKTNTRTSVRGMTP